MLILKTRDFILLFGQYLYKIVTLALVNFFVIISVRNPQESLPNFPCPISKLDFGTYLFPTI
jgi:hypothetical protein